VKSTLAVILLGSMAAALPLAAQDPAQQVPPEPPTEDLSARSRALELAGAFSNDGYRIRDGFWPGELELNRPRFLEVNLFAGNEYWFCAAANPPARQIGVAVYDHEGKPVEFQTHLDGNVAAAGFEPHVSGRYFVGIELLEGEKSPFCLVYAYK
jgi:hypothetical protein